MASTSDIRNGVVLNIDGQLWNVIEFQHVKPGKGGAFVRTKLKNVVTGKVVDRTYNAGAKIDVENVDRRDYQYLYRDGDAFVFMDTSDYDQVSIPATVVGDAANFLLENQNATVALNNGNPLYVELPASVVLEITYTEPGVQGDRSNAGTKPATVETGYEIQVPLFVGMGTKVKVDTRTGDYLGRVND
ncbi:elongation factor P [Amnibacterium flavum]|uniref:Elongation factor P n=1 Tax=Amnibacterium flavum TaxID=2173173 RepID=A0A2V1HP79_9MICO|nr:elongation factor P [Amnibacterium flavum]PVZ94358.1 elongation factor P [Amnibacterium flavum]